MREEALNGLKKGDRVAHANSHRRDKAHLVNGVVDDISLTGKSVYVRWFDEKGQQIHWAKYDCSLIKKLRS